MISTNKVLRILKLLSHTTWGREIEMLIKICKSTIQATTKLQITD